MVDNSSSLHVFQDNLGFYAQKISQRITAYTNTPQTFINLRGNERPKYLAVPTQRFHTVDFKKWWSEQQGVQKIYFHAYTMISCLFLKWYVRRRFPDAKIIWVFWSGEFYNTPSQYANLYDGYSRKFSQLHQPKINSKKELVKRMIGRVYFDEAELKNSYRWISEGCFLLKADYDNVTKLSSANFNFNRFGYESIAEDKVNKMNDVAELGTDVMVGHSGDPSLNHFELLARLNELRIENRVRLVLSYGNVAYIKLLMGDVHKFSNLKIEAQQFFLEENLYHDFQKNMGFAIFNLKIQQAWGNILQLIWNGTKVFLRKESSTFIELKNWGIHIFSVENDLTDSLALNNRLSQEHVLHNRKALLAYLSEEKVKSYYVNMLAL